MRRVPLLALLALALAGCGADAETEATGEAPSAPTAGTTATEPDAPVASDGTTDEAPTTTGGAGGGSPGSTGAATPKPLPGLPRWTAGYRGWARLNARLLPERDPDPHRGTKNVFASEDAAGNAYPAGTIVIKEGFRPGADFVGLIAAMRKRPGRNPEHNDWVFVEWTRDAPDEPFTELARGDVCTSCHVGAAETDYVFTAG